MGAAGAKRLERSDSKRIIPTIVRSSLFAHRHIRWVIRGGRVDLKVWFGRGGVVEREGKGGGMVWVAGCGLFGR